MARAQLGGPSWEGPGWKGGEGEASAPATAWRSQKAAGKLPGPSPSTWGRGGGHLLPGGVAAGSPWLLASRARRQASSYRAEGVGGQQGPAAGQGPSLGPRAAPPPPNTHTLGRVGDISQGTRSVSPLHGEGQPLLRRLRQYYRPPHPGSHPSPPRAPECPYRPSPNPQGKSLPGRGGQARLGVGLWRPGPGTQRRKFQAVTPGCLQGGQSDQQWIQRCGFLHLALRS